MSLATTGPRRAEVMGLPWTDLDGKRLPRIRLHDVRHSCATAGLGAGVDTKIMSGRLGHANLAITHDFYQHVLKEMDESAAAALAAVILGGG
jgi:integrase